MSPENSYPVRYKLKEIDRHHDPYVIGCVWADPELDHTAELMRYYWGDRGEAWAIGRKASEDVPPPLAAQGCGRFHEAMAPNDCFAKGDHGPEFAGDY